ncbi:MAG: 30S ribosomal protein S16 [Verrucomicrobiales bacterium]|nr:30S ribosomal protein S16 [Verrucomicrobiales bacterium]
MVKIRLRREGTKDRPYYKVVVTDSRARREGAYIEQVGSYNPMKDEDNVNLDMEKIDSWLSKGAQPSETVGNLIKKTRKASA